MAPSAAPHSLHPPTLAEPVPRVPPAALLALHPGSAMYPAVNKQITRRATLAVSVSPRAGAALPPAAAGAPKRTTARVAGAWAALLQGETEPWLPCVPRRAPLPQDVPLLGQLLMSGGQQHVVERRWMLQVGAQAGCVLRKGGFAGRHALGLVHVHRPAPAGAAHGKKVPASTCPAQ